MKFVVLALVTVALCVSESEGFRKYRGPVKAIIKLKFGLTMTQLQKKCLLKNKAYLTDVLDALQLNVDMGESMICDIVEKLSHLDHPTDSDLDELVENVCVTNTVVVNVKEFITSRIVKCLNKDEYPSEAKRPMILRKSIAGTCGEVKMLAKERSAISSY